MIGYVKGKFKKELNTVITDSGVGYTVHYTGITPPNNDDNVEWFVHTVVRENDITLWGFDEPDTVKLFMNLIKISGVGPSVANAVLTTLSVNEVCSLDEKLFVKAPKVGPKLAKKLSAELIIPEGIAVITVKNITSEKLSVIRATLVNLGYNKIDIDEAVAKCDFEEDEEVSSMIKDVIALLG